MNEALRTVMTRILKPVALLKLQCEEDFGPVPANLKSKPKPEPEILASRSYQRAVSTRNCQAAELQREQLLVLELEVLLTLARSHTLVAKSEAIRSKFTF